MVKDDKLVDVPPQDRVSDAEVEAFRLTKVAEKSFLRSLKILVDELLVRTGPQNRMYMCMTRFLRTHGK